VSPVKNKMLVQSLMKLPIFAGLSSTQTQQIISLCKLQSFKPGDVMCKLGSTSEDMQILIAGELGVMSQDDICLATLHPVTTVGEMGLITHQPRSAQVEALQASKTLVVPRAPFEKLLDGNVELKIQIYHNIVGSLSDKIVNDNVRLRDHLLGRLQLERTIHELRKKLDLSLDLLEELSDIEREEAVRRIDGQMASERLKVLIVDDEEAVCSYVKNALGDYEVLEAADGEEAMVLIQIERPDLVISDIRMPKMDGFTLAERVKELFPNLPILALSGYTEPEEIEGHNFVGFIGKPMQIESLRETVAGALTKN
jgi:CheY-like chemotaxis protein